MLSVQTVLVRRDVLLSGDLPNPRLWGACTSLYKMRLRDDRLNGRWDAAVIPLATMLKVIVKWPFAIWLICAFILAASLDKVPDPPAVKPHGSAAKELRGSTHHEGSFEQDRNWSLSVPASVMRWFDFGGVFEPEHPIRCARLVRQASDSSPPSLTA